MKELFTALLAIQAEAPTLQKSAVNPHFQSKFVPLDKLHETVIPILNKHGLVWVTTPCAADTGMPCLGYELQHVESGQALKGMMPLMLAKNDPQGQGSAITYARRYSLMAVLGLVADEDDDGNAGSSPSNGKRSGSSKPASSGSGASAPAATVTDAALKAGATEFLSEPVVRNLYARFQKLGLDVNKWQVKMNALGVPGLDSMTPQAGHKVDEWLDGLENKRKAKA